MIEVLIEDLTPVFISQWPLIQIIEASDFVSQWPAVELIEIIQIGASADNVAAVQALVGTATASFDTLGEVEQRIGSVNTNLSGIQNQVQTLNDPVDYTLFFENALI